MLCGKCGQEGHDEAQCPESTGAGNGPPDDALDAAIHGRPLFRRPGTWVVLVAVVLIGGGLTVRSMMKGGKPAQVAAAESEEEASGNPDAGAQVKAEPAKAGKVVATAPATQAPAAGKPDEKPVAPTAATDNVAPTPAVGTGPVLIVTVDTDTWKLKSATWKVALTDAEAPTADDKGLHYKTKAGAKYLFAFAKVDWNSSKPQEVALLKE